MLFWALVWGHSDLGIILGVGSANGGRHYVAPHWLVPHQSDPCWPYITVQKLHYCVAYYCVQWPKLYFNLNHFIVDLSETPRYFGPWYRDTPIFGVGSANGGHHYVAPHWLVPHSEWSLSTLYHCVKTLLLCCILLWLFSVTFTLFQFVSWTALLYICQKHCITLGCGIRTPRLRYHIWCGLSRWGT